MNGSQDPGYTLNNATIYAYPDVEVMLSDANRTDMYGSVTKSDNGGNTDLDPVYGRPPLLKQSLPMVAVFTIAYGVVLLLAVVNNSLVVTAIQRNNNLRTVTNMFVANLAIADITVSLLVLPITLLSNLFTEWQLGPFLCRAVPYLQALAVGASVNTLAAVAVERYLAIFYPGTMAIRPNQACIIIAVIWLVPACFQIPWAVFHRQEDFLIDPVNNTVWTVCYPDFPSANFERGFFLGVVFLTCYLMPLCFLAIFYGMIGVRVWRRSVAGIAGSKAEKNINRSKIRIVRMLVAVTAVFALSWLPLYTIRLMTLFGRTWTGQQKVLLRDTIVPIAQWLGSANSCVNPFIYCYFSEQFRKAILATFRGCRCCARLLDDQGSPRTQCSRVIVDVTDREGRKQSALVIAGTNGKVNDV